MDIGEVDFSQALKVLITITMFTIVFAFVLNLPIVGDSPLLSGLEKATETVFKLIIAFLP